MLGHGLAGWGLRTAAYGEAYSTYHKHKYGALPHIVSNEL